MGRKRICFPQTVENVAQDPAKKAGGLLPSNQRDETELWGVPPSFLYVLSVNRLMEGDKTEVGHRARFAHKCPSR